MGMINTESIHSIHDGKKVWEIVDQFEEGGFQHVKLKSGTIERTLEAGIVCRALKSGTYQPLRLFRGKNYVTKN